VVALALYAAYLAGQGMQVQAVLDAQSFWHRGLTHPITGFTASLSWLATFGARHLPWAAENLLQLCCTLLFLGFTALAWRSLTGAMRLYCLGFWVVVLASPEWKDGYYAPFSSMDRFVLALFPLAGWAATQLSHRSHRALVALFAAGYAGAAAVYLGGGWVG
jgi:hypothetical protein